MKDKSKSKSKKVDDNYVENGNIEMGGTVTDDGAKAPGTKKRRRKDKTKGDDDTIEGGGEDKKDRKRRKKKKQDQDITENPTTQQNYTSNPTQKDFL